MGQDYFFFYLLVVYQSYNHLCCGFHAAVGDSMENNDYTESFLSLCRF